MTISKYFFGIGDRFAHQGGNQLKALVAAEKKFGVHVLAVRTINQKGGLKYIRGTRRAIVEPTFKKAIVTVKAGERIEQV